MNEKNKNRTKVFFPIGGQLALIVGAIVLLSFVTLTYFTTHLMSNSMRVSSMKNNLSMNTRSAGSVESLLVSYTSNAFELVDLVQISRGASRSGSVAQAAEELFFNRNPQMGAVLLFNDSEMLVQNHMNEDFFESLNEIESQETLTEVVEEGDAATQPRSIHEWNRTIVEFAMENKDAVNLAINDLQGSALNISGLLNVPAIALFMPWQDSRANMCAVIVFSVETLSDILGVSSEHTTFVFNSKGELLSHPDSEKVMCQESISEGEFFKAVQKKNSSGEGDAAGDGLNADETETETAAEAVIVEEDELSEDSSVNQVFQISYSETNGSGKENRYIGAWQKTSVADIVVATTVSLDLALADVYKTRRNNILLAAIIFCISIITILFYSRFGISKPLYALVDASEEIQKGNFDSQKITSLKTDRMDEIGVLMESTRAEKVFLDTFAKFTNRNVAKAIATNELDFNPHLKDLAVFFSDIRGFTAISDEFKKKYGDNSAKEIIAFLNDYMSRMVNCVTLSHGNIDKFEGDAIMGLWGILRDDDLDFELTLKEHVQKIQAQKGVALSDEEIGALKERRKAQKAQHLVHVREDALNAITGTVAMRYALMKYNKDASEFNAKNSDSFMPKIKVGCGLNTGRVTAGLMGSKDKLEYTAIGDAVNFASRTEASNKLCGTDILITQDCYELIRDGYIRCEENEYKIPEQNAPLEVVVEKIPVSFDVKGKGEQYFYGVVNMPNFDVQKFFEQGEEGFVADSDCLKACGPEGPKTLKELRKMLDIPEPNFKKVNLNAEENKINVKK